MRNLKPVLALRIRSAYSFRSRSRSPNSAQLTRRQQKIVVKAPATSTFTSTTTTAAATAIGEPARIFGTEQLVELVAPDRSLFASYAMRVLRVQSAFLNCQFVKFVDIWLNWIYFYSQVLVHGYALTALSVPSATRKLKNISHYLWGLQLKLHCTSWRSTCSWSGVSIALFFNLDSTYRK